MTLAVVADGDIGLNLPDYRAAERTFQLLVQSSGRAGRGGKPGQVIIQTRDVNHYCWQYVKNGITKGFTNTRSPCAGGGAIPLHQFGLLRISYPMDWADGPTQLARITALLRSESKA